MGYKGHIPLINHILGGICPLKLICHVKNPGSVPRENKSVSDMSFEMDNLYPEKDMLFLRYIKQINKYLIILTTLFFRGGKLFGDLQCQ